MLITVEPHSIFGSNVILIYLKSDDAAGRIQIIEIRRQSQNLCLIEEYAKGNYQ